jgi:hypothetical protein
MRRFSLTTKSRSNLTGIVIEMQYFLPNSINIYVVKKHWLALVKVTGSSTLTKEMDKSATAIGEMLKAGLETGRIKGFKPHPEGFLGYIISHESHHRGQITLALKENAHIPDKKILYRIWEWGTV